MNLIDAVGILRNPWAHSEEAQREARLLAADYIERTVPYATLPRRAISAPVPPADSEGGERD